MLESKALFVSVFLNCNYSGSVKPSKDDVYEIALLPLIELNILVSLFLLTQGSCF